MGLDEDDEVNERSFSLKPCLDDDNNDIHYTTIQLYCGMPLSFACGGHP
jgi:hypothetical protein